MQPAHIPARVPEAMSPSEIGAHMASLRAQFNLTQQEVSDRLHIRTRYVAAIEEGKFELMPGKVYARGYVHTYAEFLGLDADQIVHQCFAADGAIAEITVHRPLPNVQPVMPLSNRNWRRYVVMALVVVLAGVVGSQIFGGPTAQNTAEATVAPVPEAMLATVRNLVMPTPDNKDCLTSDSALACFFTDGPSRMLNRLNQSPFVFGAAIDVSDVEILPLADAPAAPETAEPAADMPPAEETHND